jgi:hypothetical protein
MADGGAQRNGHIAPSTAVASPHITGNDVEPPTEPEHEAMDTTPDPESSRTEQTNGISDVAFPGLMIPGNNVLHEFDFDSFLNAQADQINIDAFTPAQVQFSATAPVTTATTTATTTTTTTTTTANGAITGSEASQESSGLGNANSDSSVQPSSQTSIPPPPPPPAPVTQSINVDGQPQPQPGSTSSPAPPPSRREWDEEIRQYSDDDDDSSESDDEPQNSITIEEDTSVPDAEELAEIEARGHEHSANDEEYWKNNFFRALEDPEHVPGETGRIDWTIKPVYGPLGSPNKELCMRSPIIRIGGLDWNIKFFPKGNDTDQLSIYLNCSKPKSEQSASVNTEDGATSSEASELTETSQNNSDAPMNADEQADLDAAIAASLADSAGKKLKPRTPPPQKKKKLINNLDSPDSPNTIDEDDDMSDSDDTSVPPNPNDTNDVDRSWSAAVQFGVILYNPNEPRMQISHGNTHRFCAESPDWGWARFYGPHQQIHRRQRGQRQALLRNDTLAFRVYIRVIKDDTLNLYDHVNTKTESDWERFGKTGYRAISGEGHGRSYVIAGIQSWAQLAPFRNSIYNILTVNSNVDALTRPKWMIQALQLLLYRLEVQKSGPVQIDQNMEGQVLDAFDRYRVDLSMKLDVIKFWELLRTYLDMELAGTNITRCLSDIFDGEASQVDASGHDSKIKFGAGLTPSLRVPVVGMSSVQQAVNTLNGANPLKRKIVAYPKFLQIELERQIFEKSRRRWKKLVNKVKIDEEIVLPHDECTSGEFAYSLYGFIVHTQDLHSGSYFPILRPGGPGSKWLKFMDASGSNKVTCLTRKQAIDAHEGVPVGAPSNGLEAVAYIVMYIRNDCLHDFLQGAPMGGNAPQWIKDRVDCDNATLQERSTNSRLKEVPEKQASATNHSPVNLHIYSTDLFLHHKGHGTIDTYNIDPSYRDERHYVELRDLPAAMKFESLIKRIAETYPNVENPKQIQLYDLQHGGSLLGRCLIMERAKNKEATIHEALGLHSEQREMRLVLHIVSLEQLPPEPKPIVPPPLPFLADIRASRTQAEQSAAASSQSDGPRDAVTAGESGDSSTNNGEDSQMAEAQGLSTELPPSEDSQMSGTDDLETATNAPTNSTTNSATPPAQPVDVPATEVSSRNSPATGAPANGSTSRPDEDVEMGDAAPDSNNERTESSGSAPPATEAVQDPPSWPADVCNILYFVKVFDVESQKIRHHGSFIARSDEKILDAIRNALKLPEDSKDFKLWIELNLGLVEEFDSYESFKEQKIGDGMVFIYQSLLSPERYVHSNCYCLQGIRLICHLVA